MASNNHITYLPGQSSFHKANDSVNRRKNCPKEVNPYKDENRPIGRGPIVVPDEELSCASEKADSAVVGRPLVLVGKGSLDTQHQVVT